MSRLFTPTLLMIALLTVIGCGGAKTTPLPPTAMPTTAPETPPPPDPTSEPTVAPTAAPTAAPTVVPDATVAPQATATDIPEPVDIIETLAARAEFSTLLAALKREELLEKFASPGPFTLFAPTNTAFDALPEDELEDEDVLFDTLLYHAIAGELRAEELATLDSVTTMLGDELAVTVGGELTDGKLTIGDETVGYAVIGEESITATNGTVYVVDHVLIPASAGQ